MSTKAADGFVAPSLHTNNTPALILAARNALEPIVHVFLGGGYVPTITSNTL
jgi:hypothetical protein